MIQFAISKLSFSLPLFSTNIVEAYLCFQMAWRLDPDNAMMWMFQGLIVGFFALGKLKGLDKVNQKKA